VSKEKSQVSQYENYDELLRKITDYVYDYKVESVEAFNLARLCLLDSYGCAILALENKQCNAFIKSITKLQEIPNGILVPGVSVKVNIYSAALALASMIRWLDFNDTWLAAEWGHPSDNIAGIITVAEFISRENVKKGLPPISLGTLLEYIVKVYEIQGVLALENSFNKLGIDHVILVKVASTVVLTKLLGGNKLDAINALSQAWIDGHPLRTFRHYPNTGSRKSWSAGDAVSRALWLATISADGIDGYQSALTAPKWGFNDVYLSGKSLSLSRPFSTYVIENILFKVSYPAEFHAQTAIDCILKLRDQVIDRLDDIDKIIVYTHQSAIRIIDKKGILSNPSDRDHCIQYIIAVALLYGEIKSEYYLNEIANDKRIDKLRELMEIEENKLFSIDYLDPNKRSIANAVKVVFSDGTSTDTVTVEYPLGHRNRREEAIPFIYKKFRKNLSNQYDSQTIDDILTLFKDKEKLNQLTVQDFTKMWLKQSSD